jgi:hypothetical protein
LLNSHEVSDIIPTAELNQSDAGPIMPELHWTSAEE